MMRLRSCPRCNGTVYADHSGPDREPTCLQCGWVDYRSSAPRIDDEDSGGRRSAILNRNPARKGLKLLDHMAASDASAEFVRLARSILAARGH